MTQLCLVCGRDAPCELNTNKDNDPNWPGSPCTFDPPTCYRCAFELGVVGCPDCGKLICEPCSTDSELSCGVTICGACGHATDRDIDGEGAYIHRRCT